MPPSDLSIEQLEAIIAEFLRQSARAIRAIAPTKIAETSQQPHQKFSSDLVTLANDEKVQSRNGGPVDQYERRVRFPISSTSSTLLNESTQSVMGDRLLKEIPGTDEGDLIENETRVDETAVFLPNIDEDYVLIDL